MPIYEYQCQDCQHQLEALQKISDPPLLDCPQCGKPALKKKISAVGFRLKGGGWYETDFKTGSKKNIAGESGKAAEGGKSDSGKSEGAGSAKPAESAKPAKSGSGSSAGNSGT